MGEPTDGFQIVLATQVDRTKSAHVFFITYTVSNAADAVFQKHASHASAMVLGKKQILLHRN